MNRLWQDVRYGFRILRLNASFATVAIVSLALGIGANTAIFQLLDAVRMRALPVHDAQELAIVRIADRNWASGNFSTRYSQLTNPMWEQIRDHQEGFSAIFAWAPEGLNLAVGGEVRNAQAMWVSGDFFKVLQVKPLLGRLIAADDDRRGCATGPAVVSYSFWQREFGGNPNVLGRTLTLEGHPFQVAGVTPADFYGVEVGRSYDVAIPVCTEPIVHGEGTHLDKRHHWWLASMGRLKTGWTVQRATAQLNAVSPAILEATVPPVYDAEGVKKYMAYKFAAFPGGNGFSALRREYEGPLWLLLGIAGLVLLIACVNLTNLMLARARAREREIAVRLAVGGSRWRLSRQMLVESLILALIGAALGAGLAQVLSRFLVSFLTTSGSALFVALVMDWRMLGFTAGVAVLTCLLFGLAPALRATRTVPAAVLNSTGRGMTGGRERSGLRRLLVVSQVAMSLVLLVVALLFVRSLRNLMILDSGFRQEGLLVTNLDYSKLNLPRERRQPYKKALLDRIRAIPGVDAAADTSIVPISGNGWNEDVLIGADRHKGLANFMRITPGYFKTMETPLLGGRDFDDRDTPTSPRVAIVNQTFVRKLLDGANPVGVTFQIEEYVGQARPIYQIIGLAKDSKYQELQETIEPLVYVAAAQNDRPGQYSGLVVRSNLPLVTLTSELKRTIAEVSPDIDLEFAVLKTMVRESLLRERLMATLSGFFGFLAAVLAAVGLYGLISYGVARRTNEIGIRMALGAQRRNILSMFLYEAGLLLGVGIAVGAALALSAAKLAESLLFGLKPRDPGTLLLAAAMLAAVAVAASFVPAYRGSRLDPMLALREE
jgi:predicted permease